MDYFLDLTDLNTKRIFIVGGLYGDYDALMRLLYQQRFGWADTLVLTGGFFNQENVKSLELLIFLRNSVNCYSVVGKDEANLLKDIEDPEKLNIIQKRFGSNFNEALINYIRDLPLVIKIRDYYVMHAGVDPTKRLDQQDLEVFYTIGEYDKDSRFYANSEEKSWYEVPYLIGGKHVKICFSAVYLDDIEVPAGYNLARNLEMAPIFRALILDKTQGAPSIVTFF